MAAILSWVGLLVTIFGVGVGIYYGRKGGWFKKMSQRINKSPGAANQNMDGSTGIQIAGDNNTANLNSQLPDVFLGLSGSGANNNFTGHVSSRFGQTFIAESIEIMGVKTPLDQQFSKLFHLESLNFPETVFTNRTDSVPVELIYKTLDGQKFSLALEGVQKPMAIGKYNVHFEKPAQLRRLK